MPVPKGCVAEDEDHALESREALGWPVVVKPLDASHGRGVSLNLRRETSCALAYEEAPQFRDEVFVEDSSRASTSASLVVNGKFICGATARAGVSSWATASARSRS